MRVKIEGRIGSAMRRMESIKKEKEQLDTEYTRHRQTLESFFKSKNTDRFIMDDDEDKVLVAKTWETTKVDYNLELIKEKLPKKTVQEIVDINYIIDMARLYEAIDEGLIDFKVVKKITRKQVTLNEDKLNSAYNRGLIKAEDLKGCFTTRKTTNIRVGREKRKDE